jgi:hypothetical protein
MNKLVDFLMVPDGDVNQHKNPLGSARELPRGIIRLGKKPTVVLESQVSPL